VAVSAGPKNLFRILCLDGGGAKGFYSLAVLKEFEGQLSCKLHEHFDLVCGTSKTQPAR
jgi:uncharacterized protein